jgi:hypothetical protein
VDPGCCLAGKIDLIFGGSPPAQIVLQCVLWLLIIFLYLDIFSHFSSCFYSLFYLDKNGVSVDFLRNPHFSVLPISWPCIKFHAIVVQRVLALCDFWDLEKVALAKNRISQIFILCTQ